MNRATRILAAIAATMLISGLAAFGAAAPGIASPAPVAQASRAILTDVTHASDDSGYTADIHIVCTSGTHRYLARGQSTALGSPGTACTQGGVQRIVVGADQTVYCKNYLPPYQNIYFYPFAYNEVPSYASLKCYMQRAL